MDPDTGRNFVTFEVSIGLKNYFLQSVDASIVAPLLVYFVKEIRLLLTQAEIIFVCRYFDWCLSVFSVKMSYHEQIM